MNSQDSIEVINRFYQALHTVVEQKKIRGVQTFTRKHGINRWNLITVSKKPESDMFQPAWLTYIVRDFGVSAEWLVTGAGKMFVEEQKPPKSTKNLQREK